MSHPLLLPSPPQPPFSEIFGLSNYAAWEVAEIVTICKYNGWVQPKIYQAMYNGLQRAIEVELVPALHKYGIRLVRLCSSPTSPSCSDHISGRL